MQKQVSPAGARAEVSLPRWEFIALMAALMAINALALDIMLPGLQEIGASLGVEDENRRQFVIGAYMIGFGVAQLFFGPISDRYGRRTPLLVGIAIYVAAALACALSNSFDMLLLLARAVAFGDRLCRPGPAGCRRRPCGRATVRRRTRPPRSWPYPGPRSGGRPRPRA